MPPFFLRFLVLCMHVGWFGWARFSGRFFRHRGVAGYVVLAPCCVLSLPDHGNSLHNGPWVHGTDSCSVVDLKLLSFGFYFKILFSSHVLV